MTRFLQFALIGAFVLSPLTPAVAQTGAAPAAFPSAAIDASVQKILTSSKTPSATIAIMKDGKIIYAKSYGYRDIAKKLAANVETHYEIGSMTKQFTAAAILQLRDAGKLSLDAPLATYLPKAPHAKNITIRQLLNQTTGFVNYTQTNHFEAKAGKPGSYDQIIALIAKKPLKFIPGSKWEYSNTNYILLGRVIEVVSGEPYVAYIRQHEFKPAGMTQTFTMQDEPKIPNMARGYAVKAGKVSVALPLVDAWAWSAGDIVSTVGDFAKWMNALQDGTVIPKSDYAEMTTSGRTTTGALTDYGFGLEVTKFDGQPEISHNGGTFGFLTLGARYPKQHLGVIVFSNTNSAPPENIAASIFNTLYPKLAQASLQPVAGLDPAIDARIKAFLIPLLAGKLDRTKVTPAVNKQLTDAQIASVSQQLIALGKPEQFIYRGSKVAPTGTVYTYIVKFANMNLRFTVEIDKATNLFSAFFFQPA